MLNLLRHWPAVCEVCARWPAQAVCTACRASHAPIRPRCPGCALPLAPGLQQCASCTQARQRPLDQCLARVDYNYPWVDMVAQFKFHGQAAWARHLAELMLEADETPAWLLEADLMAPIPLPMTRLRERGYNQAWELVRHLRRQTHPTGRALPDLLLRADTAQTQHALPRAERFEHARHAFSVNPKHQARLHNAHVLLVDDVMTTGATLQAAAELLRQAGASSVKALVFARTPTPENME
jgi:ComF family protein